MASIVFSHSFQVDLDEIALYISKDSPRYASRFVESVYEKADKLISFPKLGRVVPEYGNDAIREIILGNYRLIYFIKSEKTIVVIRIIHSARLLNIE
jgi:toxin ParE1/3/4